MSLMPKRVKHRKFQRGKLRGKATRGNRVVFGDYGLQALECGRRLGTDPRAGVESDAGHDHGPLRVVQQALRPQVR